MSINLWISPVVVHKSAPRSMQGKKRVEGAEFRRAVGLAVQQFEEAESWKQAQFDDAFRRELEAANGKEPLAKFKEESK